MNRPPNKSNNAAAYVDFFFSLHAQNVGNPLRPALYFLYIPFAVHVFMCPVLNNDPAGVSGSRCDCARRYVIRACVCVCRGLRLFRRDRLHERGEKSRRRAAAPVWGFLSHVCVCVCVCESVGMGVCVFALAIENRDLGSKTSG